MPDGLVQRIDEAREVAYIVKRGRVYAAPLTEVESRARIPSARVTFDLRRHNGRETATNVRLRAGSRTTRRHRRFGDLTGARRAGAKVETIATRSFGVDVSTQPFRVAEAWLGAMSEHDFDGAVSLYAPGAMLHTVDGSGPGRKHIRAELERCQLAGVGVDSTEIHGVNRYVRLDCDDGDRSHTAYFVIDRGQIVEQWIDVEPDIDESPDDSEMIQVVARGNISEAARNYAEDRIGRLLDNVTWPLLFARVKLTTLDKPSVEQPAMAEATIEFDRLLVRAHSTGTSFEEACNRVADRLDAQIRSHRDRQRHRPVGQPATPGTWRHGNLGRTVTSYFDRPEEEREVVRHKSFAPEEMTVDEAAWDMALLDYDFFLFVELGSGDDSLIERSDDGSLTLHRLLPDVELTLSTATEIKTADAAPPELAVSEAIAAMNASDGRLLFFRNRETDRANVVYRRYDGHYGLITPPTSTQGQPKE